MIPDQAQVPPDGTRAAPSPELIELVRGRYGIIRLRALRDLGGEYNLNLLVDADRERLVVRVYHPWVPAARVAAIQEVRERLRAGSWPIAPLRVTARGERLVMQEDRVVEVEGFVRATTCMNTWPRFRVGFRLLGELHRALGSMEVPPGAERPPWANHLAVDEIRQVAGPAIATIRGAGVTPEQSRSLEAAERLVEALVDAHREDGAELPVQLVHGDFWHNNVLFHRERVVLIGDFDFIGVRPRIDDLALALFFLNDSRGRDDLSSRRLRRLVEMVDLYDQAADPPLSADERHLLPFAIARSPLTFLRDLAWQAESKFAELAAAELTGLRGPEWEWALRMLATQPWREAFLP
ncbi:MAG TPA: phosphotransferase [Candidatus Dormibacteraeota bacterium]|jgi:Ser/Thr protein kinase RdoA (MazF antagonist)|nr:phosphotransferase [Candidatus Dormibacteraeota bacterium]